MQSSTIDGECGGGGGGSISIWSGIKLELSGCKAIRLIESKVSGGGGFELVSFLVVEMVREVVCLLVEVELILVWLVKEMMVELNMVMVVRWFLLTFGKHLEEIHMNWSQFGKKRDKNATLWNLDQALVCRSWRRRHDFHLRRHDFKATASQAFAMTSM
ncbi:hypothetical protein Tco_0909850 [Tanacetum coccineum]|uniref:Uncharacterized protein n=1 Tax=Tanacetum coccineum TaxID=301880 RepID=A0ABQ5CSG2_9ASTR